MTRLKARPGPAGDEPAWSVNQPAARPRPSACRGVRTDVPLACGRAVPAPRMKSSTAPPRASPCARATPPRRVATSPSHCRQPQRQRSERTTVPPVSASHLRLRGAPRRRPNGSPAGLMNSGARSAPVGHTMVSSSVSTQKHRKTVDFTNSDDCHFVTLHRSTDGAERAGRRPAARRLAARLRSAVCTRRWRLGRASGPVVAQPVDAQRLPWSPGVGNFSLRNFRICSIRASSASPVRN